MVKFPLKQFITETGWPSLVGAQINIPVGIQDGVEQTWCPHRCAEEGKYECPVGKSKVSIDTITPTNYLIKGIKNLAESLSELKTFFLNSDLFDEHIKSFGINDRHASILRGLLRNRKKKDFNLFGGESAGHPGIFDIISAIKKNPEIYTILTTSGNPILQNEGLEKKLFAQSPDLIALSLDGLNAEKIYRLAIKDVEEIKEEWSKLQTLGSEQKAYEAIYLAKLVKDKINTMFNIVIHPDNLSKINETLDAINETFPESPKNPYFAQNSFSNGKPIFQQKDKKKLENFIELMIKEQINQIGKEKKFTPRLPFWILQQVAISGEDSLKMMSGYDVWKCYNAGISNLYVQAGQSSIPTNSKIPGGHLTCFWDNKAVYDSKQIWDSSSLDIQNYLSNMFNKSCNGCTMPRLWGGEISTEAGMNPKLKSRYITLRDKLLKEYTS